MASTKEPNRDSNMDIPESVNKCIQLLTLLSDIVAQDMSHDLKIPRMHRQKVSKSVKQSQHLHNSIQLDYTRGRCTNVVRSPYFHKS
ncbi:hypothetical protein M514_13852 [Trichuris suis]|uniref:Uncharacterized protein n=1 Tax=Trichuris suis TaxID=68888 RepID=A0A085MQT9_9BILA|nr:hypothetical protein M513_13852 [Trichuris suis]KFD59585.1 hypothetical protein M514_28237 [Trichuris suis]KFD69480.1 hypothetical protein M514_13852 [Trichuris suis]